MIGIGSSAIAGAIPAQIGRLGQIRATFATPGESGRESSQVAGPDPTAHTSSAMFDWTSLADRHGIITLSDTRSAGVSRSSWYRAIRRGDLDTPYPSISVLHGIPKTHEQSIALAVRSTRRALASHRSAIDLWTATGSVDDPIDIIVGRSSGPNPRPGVVIHRPRDRQDLQPSFRNGIRCTSPLRALLDLGAVDSERVNSAMADLVISRLVTIAGIEATMARHSFHGRDGIGPLRDALLLWPLGDGVPDSILEIRFARLLVDAGLTDFTFHLIIGGSEVDFAFRRERLVIETDGREFHRTRDAFEADRRRDAELLAAGWRVMRFTWQQVTERPEWVVRMVRSALPS